MAAEEELATIFPVGRGLPGRRESPEAICTSNGGAPASRLKSHTCNAANGNPDRATATAGGELRFKNWEFSVGH
jgi:hypothetical protein